MSPFFKKLISKYVALHVDFNDFDDAIIEVSQKSQIAFELATTLSKWG